MLRSTWCLVFLVIFCSVCVLESRRVSSSGGRRTGSRPSSSGSVSKPRPSTTFSHSNSDISRLSYGHNEPTAARRPASPPKSTSNSGNHKPSAPPADHNTHQASAPRPSGHDNTDQVNKNVGWNVGSAQNPQPNPNPGNIGWNVNNQNQNRPAGTNVGWNAGQTPNQQQHANNVGAPPPYPGNPAHGNAGAPPPYPGNPSHGQNLGAPPPYPGNPSHGQNLGAPPPYPGYPSHGQNVGAPPGYPGYPSHNNMGPPPPYPGMPNNNFHNQGGHQNYPAGYPQQGGYGGFPGGSGGYGGYPGGSGGYGGYPGGAGGYGGFPGGGGGYGGFPGGFGGGYGGGNGLFGQRRSSGISGTTLVGGALLGLTLYSLSRDRNHYHYYSPNSQPVYSSGPGNGNTIGVSSHNVTGDQGSYTSYVGNMSCISIYNAREVSKWANSTLQDFYKSYPTAQFPVSVNGTNQGLNFTIVPGEIIHNETLSLTCCGTERGPVDLASITNGKINDVNCIYKTFQMPFRKLKFIPVNNTVANATDTNSTSANNTAVNSTETSNTTVAGSSTVHDTSTPMSNLNVTIATNSSITNANLTTIPNETTTPMPILNVTISTNSNLTTVPNETTTPSLELTTINQN